MGPLLSKWIHAIFCIGASLAPMAILTLTGSARTGGPGKVSELAKAALSSDTDSSASAIDAEIRQH